MNQILIYDIHFGEKKDGFYSFSFILEDDFFELFPHPSVKQGSLFTEIQMEKKTNLLIFQFTIKGHVHLTCDRCLDDFEYPINITFSQYVKFGNQYEELDNATVSIPRNQKKINVAQWLYELIELNLPFQRIHPQNRNEKSECNIEMVNKLNILSNQKNQIEKDSRWEKLNTLLNQ